MILYYYESQFTRFYTSSETMSWGTQSQAVCKANSFEEHAASCVKPCRLHLFELSDYAGVAKNLYFKFHSMTWSQGQND